MGFFQGSDNLKYKTILVTGAAAGIGRQLAEDLYQKEHCHLLLTDKNLVGLKALKAKLQKGKQPTIQIFKTDVSNPTSILLLKAKLKNQAIHILINNAGFFYSGSFQNMNILDFEKLIDTDLMGTVRLTKALLPNLFKSTQATIVNMSSLAGLIGAPGMCAYSTAKFGLMGFSQSLRSELKGRVHICSICPSFVKTDLVKNTTFAKTHNKKTINKTRNHMDDFLKNNGCTVAHAAQKIIIAIKNKKETVLINPESHVLYHLHKYFPAFSEALISKIYNQLLRKGIIAA